MTNVFEALLHDLGRIFNLSLHVDKYNACSIRIHENLIVQIQLDISQEHLFFFSKLVEIPPGKFRENVLQEALKANGLADPRIGIFGYMAALNFLSLYQRYPLQVLNGDRLAGLLGAFLEYGESWRKAIANGQPAPPSSTLNRSSFGKIV
ncbi:MAG: CesT family type III secretion system chaperone [Chlamydiota bacterium]